jgi:hypothetical protein
VTHPVLVIVVVTAAAAVTVVVITVKAYIPSVYELGIG